MAIQSGGTSRKESLQQSRRKQLNYLAVFVLFLAVGGITIISPNNYDVSRLTVGEESPVEYRADSERQVLKELEWEEMKRQVYRDVSPVVTLDQTVVRENRRRIEEWLDSDELDEQGRRIVRQIYDFIEAENILENPEFLNEYGDRVQEFRIQRGGEDQLQETTVRFQHLEEEYRTMGDLEDQVRNLLDQLFGNRDDRDQLHEGIMERIEPTASIQTDTYLQTVRNRIEKLEKPYRTVQEGEILVRSGEPVTESEVALLRNINDQQLWIQVHEALASLLLTMIGLGFIVAYQWKFGPGFFEETNKIWLTVTLVILAVGLARSADLWIVGLIPRVEYAIPFASVIMLLGIMVGAELAVLVTVFLSFLVASFFGFPLELLAMMMFGGLAAIFSVRGVERRAGLIQCGAYVAGAQILAVAVFSVLQEGQLLDVNLGLSLAWTAANGALLVPIIVIGLLPYIEAGFGITTNFRLIELVDLNHPLLQKLFERAPGTYQHSIMLSNLCERAARAVGANALLVRVGALYHDIGKVDKPQYFIENQTAGDNPHDDLKPTLSATILRAHVKEGVQRANDAGLPSEIVDFIREHHGTSLIQFFYNEAKENDDSVSREDFQYPGPRPQSRETAICMIGDAAEAATRTLEDPTPNKISEKVQQIIENDFKDGQLNDCGLTIRDLNIISAIFTRVLSSVHHERIPYPDQVDEDLPEESIIHQAEESTELEDPLWSQDDGDDNDDT